MKIEYGIVDNDRNMVKNQTSGDGYLLVIPETQGDVAFLENMVGKLVGSEHTRGLLVRKTEGDMVLCFDCEHLQAKAKRKRRGGGRCMVWYCQKMKARVPFFAAIFKGRICRDFLNEKWRDVNQ